MSPSAFSRRISALRRDRDAVDLTLSSPGAAGLQTDMNRALESLSGTDFWASVSPSAQGMISVREAIAAYLSSLHGVFHASRNVWLTASTSEAYAVLFKMFCDPGDCILVPVPGYPLLDALAGLESLHCHPYFLRETLQGWEVDLDSLESLPERTRILIVVAPHNPCGHVPAEAQWELLERFCLEHGLILVVDEVFAAYSHDAGCSLLIPDHPRVPLFRLDGLSKSAGQPQLKVGWMYAHLPEDCRAETENALEYVLDAALSVSALSAALCVPLLKQVDTFQQKLRERLRINSHAVRELLPASVHVPPAIAGWYQCIQLPGVEDESFCLSLLECCDVLVQPGFFFDFSAEDWIVVSLLPSPEVFRTGMERLASFYMESF